MNNYRKKKEAPYSIYSKIAALILATALTAGGLLSSVSPFFVIKEVHAAGTAADAASWDELEAAVDSIDNGDEITITLTANIVAEGSIEIGNKKVTITVADPDNSSFTVYSKAGRATYDSMFVVKSGGELIVEKGVTLSGKTDTSGQTCPDGNTYTADKFTGAVSSSGKTYDPKGFFIHVEGGGKASLNGTVSDFVTSRDKATTPRYVAPIVAYGDNAVFNLGADGVIKNNLVGYIVNDDMANNDAQTIKQYIKGQGPNVPRVPNAATQKANSGNFEGRPRATNAGIDDGVPGSGITGTAGAVIYKDGAKGKIEGLIENNRADTGGIMASGAGSMVTIDNENALITKNVGAQFGGGSTAEQGGGILLKSGTMSKNVAWFGGGAVFATENGIDWLQGRMSGDDLLHPQFDQRIDGAFQMEGGTLTENTAFTRGGAILADSDAVNIQKGTLSYNMGRMLGGAMYVMGDHPLYEYTVRMTGLYVHDNAAVSGETKAQNRAAAHGSTTLRDKWGDSWADLDSNLDTRLQKPKTCTDLEDTEEILSGEVTGGKAKGNTDDWQDGPGAQGTGGGVWLCAYGTTVFDASRPDQVVITNNWATGAPDAPFRPANQGEQSGYHKTLAGSDLADAKNNSQESTKSRTGITGGSDFHADTGGKGTVVINGLTAASWYNENTKEKYESTVSNGRLNLVNANLDPMPGKPQVEVYGNIARHGGGLAANGTFIFGTSGDQATPSASMRIEKKWVNSVNRTPVTIRVTADTDKGEAVLADVPLDGKANSPATEYDTIEELEPSGNTWKGRFALPMTIEAEQGETKVYSLVYTGDPFDISNPSFELIAGMEIDPQRDRGKAALGALIKANKTDDIKVIFGEPVYENASTDPKIVAIDSQTGNYAVEPIKFKFDEFKDDGFGKLIPCEDYIFTPGELDLNNIKYSVEETPYYETVYNTATGEFEQSQNVLYNIYLLEIPLVAPMTNDNWPITEKYVNDKVHSDLKTFDEVFTYDIMAYVPESATEFTISDALVDGLEFVDKEGKPVTDATTGKEVVHSVVAKIANNHKVGDTGTVARDDVIMHTVNGSPIDFIEFDNRFPNDKYLPEISINGKTVSVTFEKDKMHPDVFAKWLTGRWIQITFSAKIKDEYRTIEALKELKANVDDKTTSWEGTGTDKRSPDARDLIVANGDLALVAPLVSKIGRDPIIWAVEGPSRLFARSERGEYYATPMNDKSGKVWKRIDKDNGDAGFDFGAWQNADNRYNGKAPDANNTVRQIELADKLLEELEKQPIVKGHTLVKAAEGGSRLFVQTKDADGNTHIFTTPDNDKSGGIWIELTDPNDQAYKNAVDRLKPDQFTIRMLDLETDTITLDSKGKNWPVITEEKHEGMANQATYSVKFGNGAEGIYKTNTVTVAPKPENLEIKKIWKNVGKAELPSVDEFKKHLTLIAKKSDGSETDVTKKYADKLKVTDNGDMTYTAKWSDLPKEKGVSYSFGEIKMKGYTTTIQGKTITNTKDNPTEEEGPGEDEPDAPDEPRPYPHTGDGSNLGFWAIMTLFSALALAMTRKLRSR